MTGNITFNGGQTFPVAGIQDATTSQKGVVQVGSNLTVTSGTISVPVSSKSALGVVQAGTNINVTSGVLSVPAGNRFTPGVLSVGLNLSLTGSQVNVNTASTTQAGIVQLDDTTSSTSTTQAATANAVKLAYDAAVAAQTAADAAIPDSTFTATGDLLYGTGAGVYSVLPIGTEGQILTSTGTGSAPTWATSPWETFTGTAPIGTTTNIYTVTIPNNGVFAGTGTLTVNTGKDIIRVYEIGVVQTYNSSFGGSYSGQTAVTQTLNYVNPALPEPSPSVSVTWSTAAGGGAISLAITAENASFTYSFVFNRSA
jgi:hypothetical protein